jgi:hypothetical protein
VHILSGVLFGASLQVAETVSGRLAVIALLLALVVWFFVWLVTAFIRFAMPWVHHLRDAAVARARERSTALARGTLALLDPARPGSHALLLGAVLLLAAGWLFLGVLEDVLSRAFGGLWVNMNSAADLRRYAPAEQRHVINQQERLDQGWRRLPDRRLEGAGDPEEPFGLQWACGEADIRTRLDRSGWRLAST